MVTTFNVEVFDCTLSVVVAYSTGLKGCEDEPAYTEIDEIQSIVLKEGDMFVLLTEVAVAGPKWEQILNDAIYSKIANR